MTHQTTVIVHTYAPTNNRHVRRYTVDSPTDALLMAARESYAFGWERIVWQKARDAMVVLTYREGAK